MLSKPFLITIAFLLISISSESQVTGNIKDSRDGKTYETIKIGTQEWMAENLNYESTDSYCYDDREIQCDSLGRLYTWQAAQGACPSGWHLPSDDEWKQLEMHLGMSQTEANKFGGETRGTNEGKEIKATSGWYTTPINKSNGTDKHGITALPGGYRSTKGIFDSWPVSCYWWSATETSSSTAFNRNIHYHRNSIYRYNEDKNKAFSVRCIKD